ncbi:uncharacterized protein LOC124355793 [Homalodisca vitripennis]|uniref:uncharacterized protein LOC124355793 n=1 Tax=Homalodisca vitripennis TaxID=197043 RepID=UPI001EEA095E|nr:uncharacterized protein LOC124355793 [Homalodisca vitripennis]
MVYGKINEFTLLGQLEADIGALNGVFYWSNQIIYSHPKPLVLIIEVWEVLVQGLIAFVVAIILLKGTYQRNPKYVKLWVYFSTVTCVVDCLMVTLLAIHDVFYLITLLIVPLNIYIILVVYSFYREQIQDPNPC